MNNDAVRVNRIDFWAAIPSLHLLEAVRLAFSLQCLIPACLGVLLMSQMSRILPGDGGSPFPSESLQAAIVLRPFVEIHVDARTVATDGVFSNPFAWSRLLLNFTLLGFTGVAISRASGIQQCLGRRTGAVRSLRHSVQNWRAIAVATVLNGILAMVCYVMLRFAISLTGLFAGGPSPGVWSGVILWTGAVFLIVVWSICHVGWLLSLAAIGVDSCSGAESLSRGISYALSRFRRTVWYAAVILLITLLSSEAMWWLLTEAELLVAQIMQGSRDSRSSEIAGFQAFRSGVLEAWMLSVVFSGITVSYVLLRRFEDGVDLREADGCKLIKK